MKTLIFCLLVIVLSACTVSRGVAPNGMSEREEGYRRAYCEQKARAAYQHPNWVVGELPDMAAALARNRCLTEQGFVGVR